jgi:hypothetical protein
MKWAPLVFLFCWPSLGIADELILKDGKNISWKSITDDGATVTVVTTDGKKLSFRKDEIDRVVIQQSKDAPPGAGVLTGASISFDKKKVDIIDLLAKIDPKKDGITGSWAWTKQHSLWGQANFPSSGKCQIASYIPPAEYDLTLTIARKNGGDGLQVGLVSPLRQQFNVSIDVMACTVTGFSSGEGEAEDKKAGRVWPGKFFEKDKPRTITFMVRKDAMVFQADGKDFMTYKGDWSKMGSTAGTVQKNDCFYFITYSSEFEISRITLTSPKEKP